MLPRHPLEEKFHAPAVDIMDAILKGFRAQVDVKGKLAELYLAKLLEQLQIKGIIDRYEWSDNDGAPDFCVHKGGRHLLIECKNIRSPQLRKKAPVRSRVELQKTRNGTDSDGKKTRGYSADHFQILAACLFNHTSKWNFAFISSTALERRPDAPNTLVVFHEVPLSNADLLSLDKPWSFDLGGLIRKELTAARG